MIIYPAIDIMSGRAVRLRQGRKGAVTIYGDPVEMANRWKQEGAEYLHVVDLDAAFTEMSNALPLIKQITKAFVGTVEMGGGVRSMDDIMARMEAGVDRVVIGTSAVLHSELVETAAKMFPGKIVVAIDAKDGMVTTRGWVQTSRIPASVLAMQMKDMGVEEIIYTDISRDGTMSGPNVEATRQLVEATGLKVIASGGVGSLDDIRALKEAGCAGVILGKSLYENAFSLAEALEIAK